MSPLRVCTQCGFTYAEFRERGLLGCPECYASFGDALFADLLQMHPDLYRRAPETSGESRDASPAEDPARLRELFSDALRGERYEEAATLRQRLRDLGLGPL
jgi:protein arginine kinase activator